jgi:hypothetical protein
MISSLYPIAILLLLSPSHPHPQFHIPPDLYMNTANTTPNPTTVTIPPDCASKLLAAPVLKAVPEEVVLLALEVLLAVEAALSEAEALPDALVEFEEPVAPEPFADFVAVAVELLPDPDASVDFAPLVLVVDLGLLAVDWGGGWDGGDGEELTDSSVWA